MYKKFEINQTQIKGGRQLGRKLVIHNSKSDLPLVEISFSKKDKYVSVDHFYFFIIVLTI